MAMTVPAALPPTLAGTGELFQLLRDGTPRTRAELAQLSSLARSTVTARVDALLSSGLLAPVGEAASTGGRPPTRFALNPDNRVVLAIDLGASHASVALTDLSGRVLDEETVDSDIADGPEVVLDRVATIGQKLLVAIERPAADVAGIGIGVPGPVEHATGRPANPPIMPGWHDFDVPAHLGRTFAGPVLVDNDVNLMALGEYATSWQAAPHLLLVKVATGIGAGIVSDGRLMRGALGSAGDLGHVRVAGARDDVVCRCGNTGCLEAVAAGPAIAAKLRERGLDVESSQDIVDAVVAGEVAALQAVREAGRDLGTVLATCVNLLNPSVIVIGGKLSEAGEYLLAGVREVVYQRSLPLATHDLRIVSTSAASRGGTLGASAMVIDAVLAPRAVDDYVARQAAAQTA
jgi:predicted NBD/HSP70 family sugar kinase